MAIIIASVRFTDLIRIADPICALLDVSGDDVTAAAVKLNALRANGRRICGNASGMRGGIDCTEAFAIDHLRFLG
jgi:hypothetical protein